MRILLVTDAWFPQINGVVRTLATLKTCLEQRGHEVLYITPDLFRTIPCPSYSEIRLALFPRRRIRKMLEAFRPCVVHIAIEGPLGVAARAECLRREIPFTTAFHTKFPEYVEARFGIPARWIYAALRRFHAPSQAVMVATQGIEDELVRWGFRNIRRWTRGVDTILFQPRPSALFQDLPRPVFVNVGRVAVEKNLEAFLSLDLPGSKVVVGDGPHLATLKRRFPQAIYVGAKTGEDLARHFAAADVFVFPSLTDTFGLVTLEALACGVPVAAYPVAGPRDVLEQQDPQQPVGILDSDLRQAALRALEIPRERCRIFAEQNDWSVSIDQFLANVAPFDPQAALGETPDQPRHQPA